MPRVVRGSDAKGSISDLPEPASKPDVMECGASEPGQLILPFLASAALSCFMQIVTRNPTKTRTHIANV